MGSGGGWSSVKIATELPPRASSLLSSLAADRRPASLARCVNQFLTFRASLRQNVIWVRSLPRIYLQSLTGARAPPRALDHNTNCLGAAG
jgi:hypothetical protein